MTTGTSLLSAFVLIWAITVIVEASPETCNVQLPTPTNRREAAMCKFIDKCAKSGPMKIITARGCFCDNYCALYGDCCPDYDINDNIKPLPPGTFSCRDVDGVWSKNLPMYVVDKCHPGWPVGRLKQKCERSSRDILHNWPVSDSRNIVYKNIFCVQCNSVTMNETTFWDSTLMCHVPDNTTDSATVVIQKNMESRAACNLTYLHPNGDNHFRNCKPVQEKCPQNWTNKCVKEKCEARNGTTGYRYDPEHVGTTFKNAFCALCHGAKVTCVDVATKRRFKPTTYSQAYGTDHALTITIDLNKRNVTVKRKVGSGYKITREEMTTCPKSQIFDVFIGKCRIVNFAMMEGSVFSVQIQNACSKYVTVPPSGYVMQDDGTVYVNSSGLYKKGAFVLREKTLYLCTDMPGVDGSPNLAASALYQQSLSWLCCLYIGFLLSL